jgi:site-specific recombinase XerD
LPLPERLGQALSEYVKHGRPPSDSRQVFLRHALGVGAPTNAALLKSAVRRAWRRTGLKYNGTHILRHSVATRMKRAGASLKVIADTLGHNGLQTAALYSQVDLPALRRVAQPWPTR